MFDDSHETTTHDWAASLVIARARILKLADECNGPFFVTIRPCRSSSHISQPYFIAKAGGGWKIISPMPAVAVEPSNLKSTKRQQGVFEFPENVALQVYC
jgi:hypothetical protein